MATRQSSNKAPASGRHKKVVEDETPKRKRPAASKEVAAPKAKPRRTVKEESAAPAATKKRSTSGTSTKEQPVEKSAAFNAIMRLDDQLDAIEKDYSLSGTTINANEKRLSTGMLSIDLILSGGIVPGWYTDFGPEQSCKSTGATTFIAAAIDTNVPIISYFDFEGSFSPDYVSNILTTMGVKMTLDEMFGVRDPHSGGWSIRPRIRYYSEGVAEKFFDYLAKLERLLPDKVCMNDEWYYVYDSKTPNAKGQLVANKEALRVVGNNYDKNYFKKTGRYRIPAEDGSLQAFVIVDSYPAMLPEKMDVDDPGSGMAAQARMFSDQIKRVKGKLRAKRIAVVGINQLRLRPAVMFGCFHGSSKVVMADGSQKAIRDLVKDEIDDKVLSYNTRTGKVEARKIVGWYENGTTNSWLQFKCSGVNTGNGLSQFRCTPNHLLLGADGVMRPAGEYRVGQQLMANSYQPLLSYGQQQLVLGSIIGDGYFNSPEKLGISHNEHQIDYLTWKKEVFGTLVGSFYGANGKGYTRKNGDQVLMHHLETKQIKDPWFAEQYEEHRKGITGPGYRVGTLGEKLDGMGVAIWVMDDGSKAMGRKIFVKTVTMSRSDLKGFVKSLNKRLGLGLEIGDIGDDHGVKITDRAMQKLVTYMHPQFKEVVASGYPDISLKDFGANTYVRPDSDGTYGAPVTISSIAQTSNMTGKDSYGHSIHDKTKYDIEVEGNHTYCVNGVFVHNSPEYEPAGEALKFFSDVRLKFSPRALSGAPGISSGKGYIEEEDSAFDDGLDEYRYIHIRAHKNKLSTPNLEGWLRLWVKDSDGQGRGFDPVWDTWYYLLQTGQLTGGRRSIKLQLDGREPVKKSLTWLEFKQFVLGSARDIKEICADLKIKPFKIREFCKKQMASGKGIDLFFQHKKVEKKEEADDIDTDGSDD